MNIDVINGLLGSGKTTYLLNILNQKERREKVAVLVNEFGEIGVDGDILGGHGADVVELPNGCICCSLNSDLRNQIRVIAETYKPDRLYIEPTGIATIKNLMSVLGSLSLEKYIDGINAILIIDASSISDIIEQNYGFVETQVKSADVVIVNKCDKATANQIEDIKAFIKGINNSAQICLTSFGQVLNINGSFQKEYPSNKVQNSNEHGTTCGDHCEVSAHVNKHAHEDEDSHAHQHEHELPLKKYEQFSVSSVKPFDIDKVKNFLSEAKEGKFGSVDRAKGIFKGYDDRWVRFDIASGDLNEILLEMALAKVK